MSPRQTIPLPFTAGLDRASGQEVVSARAMADARNVYARSASALSLRPGMTPPPYPAIGWGTDLVGACQMQGTKDILVVVFDRPSRALRLYRINPIAAPTTQAVTVNGGATWGTLNASASPPHVTFAEQAGKLFLAHDEPLLTYRLPTIVYTPDAIDANVGVAVTLTADLDSSGTAQPVAFRGVYAHHDALWGWGYGTFAEPDTPHILRVSDPGDPLTFRPEGLFYVGAKGDPIMGCAAAGTLLAVRKRSSGFRVSGYSSADYAIEPCDALFGVEAARLVLSVGSDAFEWGAAGARKILPDGSSVDMALPLDLAGPSPATLPAMGLTADGYAIYDPNTRVLEFCFPDLATTPGTTRCYACSLVTPAAPQWTYFERQVTARCAALIDPVKGAAAPVTAYASGVSVVDGGIQSGNAARQFTISFTQHAQAGDEQWQVFARRQSTSPTPLPYQLLTTLSATTGTTLSATLLNIPPLAPYDFALRATRAGAVLTGYESSDPAQWTGATVAGAKTTGVSGCGTPGITSALWQRTSPTAGQLNVAFTLPDTTAPVLMQQSPDGTTAWATIATLTNGERSFAFPVPAAQVGSTQYVRALPSRTENGVTVDGTASTVTPALCGFAGIPTILDQWYEYNPSYPATDLAVMTWVQHAIGATQLELQISPDGTAWTTVFSGAATSAGFSRFDTTGFTVSGMGTPAFLRARNGQAGFGGAIDYGQWTASATLAAYSSAAATDVAVAVGTPAFSAPRTANNVVSGIAAAPGSRVLVAFTTPGGVIIATARATTDGAVATPLPTNASGQTIGFSTVNIAPGNYNNIYQQGFTQGVSP